VPYVGNQPTSVAFLTDTFNGNGSTTAFTLSAAPATSSSILVAVSGVLQDPSTYSTTGTTLNFSAAPPSGTGNISVRFLGIPASGVTTTAYRTQTEFTATAGQTTFSVPSYTVGYIDVYRNGVLLGSADFTATNGTTVVLTAGASAGDLVETVSFYVSSVVNAIPAVAGAVNDTYLNTGAVTQSKLGTGVAGTGPAFSAYKSSSTNQTDGVLTKVVFDTELWDTASCYDTSLGRFTPNVAGYYQLNSSVDSINSGVGPQSFAAIAIHKNGTSYKYGVYTLTRTPNVTVSAVVYANGTTDYFEIYYVETGGQGAYGGPSIWTWFDGALVRAA
jgi:hypothetical protein